MAQVVNDTYQINRYILAALEVHKSYRDIHQITSGIRSLTGGWGSGYQKEEGVILNTKG